MGEVWIGSPDEMKSRTATICQLQKDLRSNDSLIRKREYMSFDEDGRQM